MGSATTRSVVAAAAGASRPPDQPVPASNAKTIAMRRGAVIVFNNHQPSRSYLPKPGERAVKRASANSAKNGSRIPVGFGAICLEWSVSDTIHSIHGVFDAL